MRRKIIVLTAALLGALAFLLLIPAAGVPILAYHMVNDLDEPYSISPGEFEEQMAYLAQQGYTSITLAQLLDGMEGKTSLPPKPIVITFDDGYTDNAEIALPIIAPSHPICFSLVRSSTVETPPLAIRLTSVVSIIS